MWSGCVKKILFASYGGGHSNALIPVIKSCSDKLGEDIAVTVIGLTTALEDYRTAGIDAIPLSDVLKQHEQYHLFLEIGKSLCSELPINFKVGELETFVYHGAGFYDLIQTYGKKNALALFEGKGRSVFEFKQIADFIVSSLKPDLVVVTNSPRLERALVISATSERAPSIVVVDGFAFQEHWLADNNYGSRLCVFHESVRKRLVSIGRRSEHIIVTGNPAFRESVDVIKRKRGRLVAPKFCSYRCKVLYLAQNEPDIQATVVQEVLSELNRLHSSRSIDARVRFHPNQRESDFESAGTLKIVSQTVRLEDALIWSDVVITASSSAGLLALMCDIPLVEIRWSQSFGKVGDYALLSNLLVGCDSSGLILDAIAKAHLLGVEPDRFEHAYESDVLGVIEAAIHHACT